jgi:hypothetical protein
MSRSARTRASPWQRTAGRLGAGPARTSPSLRGSRRGASASWGKGGAAAGPVTWRAPAGPRPGMVIRRGSAGPASGYGRPASTPSCRRRRRRRRCGPSSNGVIAGRVVVRGRAGPARAGSGRVDQGSSPEAAPCRGSGAEEVMDSKQPQSRPPLSPGQLEPGLCLARPSRPRRPGRRAARHRQSRPAGGQVARRRRDIARPAAAMPAVPVPAAGGPSPPDAPGRAGPWTGPRAGGPRWGMGGQRWAREKGWLASR